MVTRDLTFRGNPTQTRYGWLRLTPAYSVGLVDELLRDTRGPVLDPFGGTGTTALLCAQRGLECDTLDINPFLVWLMRAKTAEYTSDDLAAFVGVSVDVAAAICDERIAPTWAPPLYQIEKWWNAAVLGALQRAMGVIHQREHALSMAVLDLLKVAFCQAMLRVSNAGFHHPSMTLAEQRLALPMFPELDEASSSVLAAWRDAIRLVRAGAEEMVCRTRPRVLLTDARTLSSTLASDTYASVVTSPPYPNRMTYIRELRPHMYWLGYLTKPEEAAALDWQAIGGTWGTATSRVAAWSPERAEPIAYPDFAEMIAAIGRRSDTLARYVHKYFYDMAEHARDLIKVVRPGGQIAYVVGNSIFYGVGVPVQDILAGTFRASGFTGVAVRQIRRRAGKSGLVEYVVSGSRPAE